MSCRYRLTNSPYFARKEYENTSIGGLHVTSSPPCWWTKYTVGSMQGTNPGENVRMKWRTIHVKRVGVERATEDGPTGDSPPTDTQNMTFVVRISLSAKRVLTRPLKRGERKCSSVSVMVNFV